MNASREQAQLVRDTEAAQWEFSPAQSHLQEKEALLRLKNGERAARQTEIHTDNRDHGVTPEPMRSADKRCRPSHD